MFSAKRKLLSCQIQMNVFFKNNTGRKIRKYDRKIHKAKIIPVEIYQTMKSSLLQFNQKEHVKWNFGVIYGYHLLINLSQKLWFLNTYFSDI